MKTTFHKIASIFLMIFLICFSLSACGSSTEELLEQARNGLQPKYPDFDNVLRLLDEVGDQELPEVQELRNECHFRLGCQHLFTSFDPVAATEEFGQCVDHEQATIYLAAAKCISANDPHGAIRTVSQILDQSNPLHTADQWLHVLQSTISSTVFDKMTIEERFELEAMLQTSLSTSAPSPASAALNIAEYCKNSTYDFEPVTNNINNYVLDAETYQNLEEICTGTDSGHKLLIVRLESYPGRKSYKTIAFDLMRMLPSQYQPTSLEEVSKILLLNYQYDATGFYLGGTNAYRMGVDLYLQSLNEYYDASYEYSARYTLDSHVDTIWGPEPPDSIPMSFEGKYLIAEHPDLRDSLQNLFYSYF